MIACHLTRGAVVDLRDHAAQHGGAVDARHGGVIFKPLHEGGHLVTLNIDEEIGRGHVRQIAGDGTAQVAVDLADGSQDRKAKAQRQDHRCRLVPLPTNGGQRPAQYRAAPRGATHPLGQGADCQRGQNQQHQSPKDAPRCPERQHGRTGKGHGGADQCRQKQQDHHKHAQRWQRLAGRQRIAKEGGGAHLFGA